MRLTPRALTACLILMALAAGPAGSETWQQVTVPDTPKMTGATFEGSLLWLPTDGHGLLGFDGGQWISHTVADGGMRKNSPNALVFVDSDHEKWVTRDVGKTIDRLDDAGTFVEKSDDRWFYYNSMSAEDPGPLGSKRIFSMAEDLVGNKWFGVRDENGTEDPVVAFLLEGSDTSQVDDEWYTFDEVDTATSFADGDVRALAVDGEGRLWIGYFAKGIDVWDFGGPESLGAGATSDDSWLRYTEEDVLPSDEVRAFHIDDRGRIWVGTLGGLAVYEPDTHHWMTVDNLPGVQARTIDSDAQGHIWVGTEHGLAMLYTNGVVALTYGVSDGIQDDRIDHVAVDRASGSVWCISVDDATAETSLQVFRSGFAPGTGEIFVYPNPWTEGRSAEFVNIFGAPDGSKVEIYDIMGELRRTLPQTQPYIWDSLDSSFNEVPSGIYVVRVATPDGRRVFLKSAVVR